MNRFVFGVKNVYDKLIKVGKDPGRLRFYLRQYVFSKSKKVEPDVYLISYPKCGSTWIRIALLKYLELCGYEEATEHVGYLIKLPGSIILKIDKDMGDWVPAPFRIDQLHFNDSRYRGKKICFVVRNPCDILVSSWYHLKYREKIYSKGLSEFIRDDTLGIDKVIAFMNMWLGNMHIPDKFYLVTYEDLRKDPVANFRALFEFIGLDIDENILKSAVGETSFEKMKQMEQKGELLEPWMMTGAENSEKSMKVRKGKINGYKDELSIEDIEFLQERIISNLTLKLPYFRKKNNFEKV